MHRRRTFAAAAVLAGMLAAPPFNPVLAQAEHLRQARQLRAAPPLIPVQAQTVPTAEETHNALRALKDRMVDAVNKQNMDAIAGDLAPDAVITTMTNDVVKGPDEFKAYIAKLFTGQSRLIDSLMVTAEADDLSKLFADNQVAVATGSSSAHFKLATGRELDWPIRWSATLVRRNDKWLITNAHFSSNAIDNPLVNAKQTISSWMPWAFGLAGLATGFLLSRLLRREVRP